MPRSKQARSREKGAEGEREVVALLAPVFPGARRRFSSEEAQGTELGRDVSGTPGYCVQVQKAKTPRIERKFREASVVAGACEIPLAFTRRSAVGHAHPWLVTLRAEDLVGLLSSLAFMKAANAMVDRTASQMLDGDPVPS